METVIGSAEIDDVPQFLAQLQTIGERHGCLLQAIDARYVAGATHLRTAVRLTRRALDNERAVAADPAMELLLYLAATRQIDEALDVGVTRGEQTLVIVIDGEDEDSATSAVLTFIDPGPVEADERAIADWFGITASERRATDATLEALVCERVALRALEG